MTELPNSWVSTTLDQIALWGSGGTPSRRNLEFFYGDIPWIKTGELGSKYVRTAEEYISQEAIKASSAKTFPKGSIGIAMYGATIGKVSIWAMEAATNQACAVAQCYLGVFNEFLYYFLTSQQNGFIEAGKGGAQPNISQAILKDWPIPLPPTSEQHRIIAKIEELFSELDKGIEVLTTAREQLKAYRQSVLKHAFEANSVDWPEFTVGQLITDIRYGTAKKCTVDPTKTPVLRIPNIASGRIDLEDLKHTDFTADELDKLKLEQGDILLVRSNGSVSLVGLSAVVTGKAAGYAYAGYLIRLRLKKEIILPEFLSLYLHSPHVRIDIERQARSTSGVHNVNSDEIRAISIRVPPIQTQQLIIGTIGKISTQIDALESCTTTELQRGAALRQSILKKAFSGQLVNQDAKDEPASVLLERIRAECDAATTKTQHKTKRAKNGKKRDKAA